MKCPLSNYILEKDDADNEMLVTDCLKEECAWWVPVPEACAITLAAANIVGLVAIRDRLLEKMPHSK